MVPFGNDKDHIGLLPMIGETYVEHPGRCEGCAMKSGNGKSSVKEQIKSRQDAHHIRHAIPVLIDMLSFGDAEHRQLATTTLNHIERCCAECRSLLVESRLR
jgi:hypothetical protein